MDRMEQMALDLMNGETYTCIAGEMLTKAQVLAWLRMNMGKAPSEPLAKEGVRYLAVRKDFNWGGSQWWVGKLEANTVKLMISYDAADTGAEDKARALCATPEEVERQYNVRQKAVSSATGKRPSTGHPGYGGQPDRLPSKPAAKPAPTDASRDMAKVIEDHARGQT